MFALSLGDLATLRPADFLRLAARLATLSRTRRALAALDDHALRDIGLTRAQAAAEAARPFWDASPHWRRCRGQGAANMNVSVGNA